MHPITFMRLELSSIRTVLEVIKRKKIDSSIRWKKKLG